MCVYCLLIINSLLFSEPWFVIALLGLGDLVVTCWCVISCFLSHGFLCCAPVPT